MDKLIAQLKRHEGAVKDTGGFHVAYRCPAGKLTIGYGHNLDANSVPGLGPDSRIDDACADRLLRADVYTIIPEVNRLILPWGLGLSQARHAVLINMAFNLGINGLAGFKRMLSALERGDYDEASAHMLDSRWARQVGGRARELARQMKTGEWQRMEAHHGS